jgi:ArsR family transcriptional regulator, arsenate/arsenite/antimonite-responsive transcriptional repressor
MVTQVRIQQNFTPARAHSPRKALSPKKALRVRGPIDATLDVELFRALGDPTRLVLLACLAKCARPCSVSEVAECCRVDLSVVSRHLSLMARAGLLEARKEGRIVRYSVRFSFFAGALRALADAIEQCAVSGCVDAACAVVGCAACAQDVTERTSVTNGPSPTGEMNKSRRARTGARRSQTGASS